MTETRGGLMGLEALDALTGEELLTGMCEGLYPLPPFIIACGGRLVEVGAGRATFAARMDTGFANFVGTAHGGWLATLLDTAMSFAGGFALGRGEGATSLEFKVSFLRPMAERGAEVLFDAEVQRQGRRVFVAQGWARDASRTTTYAHATTTCLILPIGGKNGLPGAGGVGGRAGSGRVGGGGGKD